MSRTFAERHIKELDRRAPKLTVQLSSNAARGAVVSLDGQDLSSGVIGKAQLLDPGEHTIELRVPGGRVERASIRIAEGEQRTIEIGSGSALVVDRSSRKQPAPQPTPHHANTVQPAASGSSRTLGFVLGGIGAVGLAAAGVTGVMILDRRSTVKSECNGDKLCTQAGADAADSGRTLLIVNTVAWAVGVLGLGAGAYLVLSADDGPPLAGLVVRGAF